MNKKIKIILLVIGCIIMYFIMRALLVTGLVYTVFLNSKVEVNNNINKYNKYMFNSAIEKYQDKWGMDESIFPKKITKNMDVEDYKMVYYDPWDKEYLSYLVVKYEKEDYDKEIERLKRYKSTAYLGYYGVSGFSKYELLAMYADSYHGFIYAITDNDSKIIYVELIFCNYHFDIDYEKYINKDYLPDGFDATINNNYKKQMLEENDL